MEPRRKIKCERRTHNMLLSKATLWELRGMIDAITLERDVALGRVKLEVPEWLAKMYPKAKGLACP